MSSCGCDGAELRCKVNEEVSILKSWVFPSLDSKILSDFPPISVEFRQQKFTLLRRGMCNLSLDVISVTNVTDTGTHGL
jgi:hypothetical protein